MDEALLRLVDAVEKASPAMWEAAQQSVKADIVAAWFMLILSIGVLILAAVGSSFAVLRGSKYADWPPIVVGVSIFCSIFAVLIGAVNFYTLIVLRTAPDYYAIKALADLLPG